MIVRADWRPGLRRPARRAGARAADAAHVDRRLHRARARVEGAHAGRSAMSRCDPAARRSARAPDAGPGRGAPDDGTRPRGTGRARRPDQPALRPRARSRSPAPPSGIDLVSTAHARTVSGPVGDGSRARSAIMALALKYDDGKMATPRPAATPSRTSRT